jgi:hypothetical protein
LGFPELWACFDHEDGFNAVCHGGKAFYGLNQYALFRGRNR